MLSAGEIAGFENRGVLFYYIDGEVARTNTIYPVRVPWTSLDEMEGHPEVLRVESHWRPAMLPTLDWFDADEGGAQVSSGVYFCELVQETARQTRKMTLVR